MEIGTHRNIDRTKRPKINHRIGLKGCYINERMIAKNCQRLRLGKSPRASSTYRKWNKKPEKKTKQTKNRSHKTSGRTLSALGPERTDGAGMLGRMAQPPFTTPKPYSNPSARLGGGLEQHNPCGLAKRQPKFSHSFRMTEHRAETWARAVMRAEARQQEKSGKKGRARERERDK